MFHALETVALKQAQPGAGLAVGAVGVVLEVFRDGQCLVEFCDKDGQTLAEIPLPPGALEPVAATAG
ncbi:DUF4926 domain-containing protein [Acidovorax sp. sif1233]|uniref:DUF4926 domain-containing protein n=1 Tax=Acidovorax sp. sif1233 TaxID=2854792 RepID=UPI001C476537|nr:DUF4926 domain-containing protein [Acidovorax sp. sif1233]MBV7454293.1 DUF4926 domain-containing protein [Acidovorax sp. sif1233]